MDPGRQIYLSNNKKIWSNMILNKIKKNFRNGKKIGKNKIWGRIFEIFLLKFFGK